MSLGRSTNGKLRFFSRQPKICGLLAVLGMGVPCSRTSASVWKSLGGRRNFKPRSLLIWSCPRVARRALALFPPQSILLRQGEHLAEGYRVFAVAPEMTVEDTARMVVEGLCPMPPPFDSDRTHQRPRFAGRAENAERVISEASTTGFGDGETARRSGSTLAFLHDESHNEWSAQERLRGDEYPQHEPRMTRVEDTEGDAGGYVGGRHPSPPIAVPSRGFHLINLHAVVRNSIEWSRSLPKVAKCVNVLLKFIHKTVRFGHVVSLSLHMLGYSF